MVESEKAGWWSIFWTHFLYRVNKYRVLTFLFFKKGNDKGAPLFPSYFQLRDIYLIVYYLDCDPQWISLVIPKVFFILKFFLE